MTVFQGAVDATFAAFGIDAVYTPAGGEPVPVRVIARRPDTIVGFGETSRDDAVPIGRADRRGRPIVRSQPARRPSMRPGRDPRAGATDRARRGALASGSRTSVELIQLNVDARHVAPHESRHFPAG